MKRLVLVVSILLTGAASIVLAQNKGAELDKAYEETKAAWLALKDAEQRRDQGIEPQAGERQSSAAGGSRPTEQYFGRQAQLEQEVELARKRYEAAQKRWNDLK
jgi:hypothetical protein